MHLVRKFASCIIIIDEGRLNALLSNNQNVLSPFQTLPMRNICTTMMINGDLVDSSFQAFQFQIQKVPLFVPFSWQRPCNPPFGK